MSPLKLWAVRLSTACLLCLSLWSPITAQDREAQLAEAVRLTERVGELYQAGRSAEAIPLAERALAIREKVLGKEHPLMAESLNNLALLYKEQRDYARALPLLKEALAIVEKAFGSEHTNLWC